MIHSIYTNRGKQPLMEPYPAFRECAMESGVRSRESGVNGCAGVTAVTQTMSHMSQFSATPPLLYPDS
jgi:hypothetical protein